MRKRELKKWEKFLILLSLLIFLFSLLLYWGDFRLRRFFIDMQDDSLQPRIGDVREKSGQLTRESSDEVEFRPIDQHTALLNHDLVVSGPDSTATIQFDDGGSLELGPSTMVELSFESQFTFAGITRSPKINVITGSITGRTGNRPIELRKTGNVVAVSRVLGETFKLAMVAPKSPPPPPPPPMPPPVAAAPSPSPSPVALPSPEPSNVLLSALKRAKPKEAEILLPKRDARFKVADGSLDPMVPIDFSWKTRLSEIPLMIVVKNLDKAQQVVFREKVKSSSNRASVSWKALSPGHYGWELRTPEAGDASRSSGRPKPLAQSAFYVEPEFFVIETLEPLIGGEKSTTNVYSGKKRKFDVTLNWKPYPKSKNYDVHVFHSTEGKPGSHILVRKTGEAQVAFNKGTVFSGQFFYQVASPLESGFVAQSKIQAFVFDFLAPILTRPRDRAAIKRTSDEIILITWQKTKFTDTYMLEVSRDPLFQTSYFKTPRIGQNYFILRMPEPGEYWWRARSFSRNFQSPPSAGKRFVVTP